MAGLVENSSLVTQWEKIWESDYGKPSERASKARMKIDALLEHGLSFRPGMKVLDGGCGDGSTLWLLKRDWGVEPYGVDISPTALARAEQLNAEENLGMNLKEADVRSIPFPDNFFDAVLSWGVIEHFKDYDRAIDEFHRILKPGSQLALVQPHKYSLRHLKKFWLMAKNQWPYGLQINFSGRFLKRTLSQHGFRNVNYFVRPYRPRGFVNTMDYNLHRVMGDWGYYLFIQGKKT